MMDNGNSYLSSHPHLKNFAYVAVALVVAGSLVGMFGQSTVKTWVEGAARALGYEITAIPDTEEPEEIFK
jgi:hypothetical protein